MKPLLQLTLFVSLASAIWPIPTSYEHGDTVLLIRRDKIKWRGNAAKGAIIVGSIFLTVQNYPPMSILNPWSFRFSSSIPS